MLDYTTIKLTQIDNFLNTNQNHAGFILKMPKEITYKTLVCKMMIERLLYHL
jgi:hypothetical protein